MRSPASNPPPLKIINSDSNSDSDSDSDSHLNLELGIGTWNLKDLEFEFDSLLPEHTPGAFGTVADIHIRVLMLEQRHRHTCTYITVTIFCISKQSSFFL